MHFNPLRTGLLLITFGLLLTLISMQSFAQSPGDFSALHRRMSGEEYELLKAQLFHSHHPTYVPDQSRGAPANDNCLNAAPVGVLPASIVFDNTNAASNPLVPACGVISGPFNDVWYSVIGTGNTITATTCNAGTVVSDTKIAVYCRECEIPVCVGGNDDSCAGFSALNSTVTWCSQLGVTYLISVGTFAEFTPTGIIQLDVTDDGTPCGTPVDCNPLGACCLPGQTCLELGFADCQAQGGSYRGDGSLCADNAVVDGGLEAGPFGGIWTETSTNFGTPLCSISGCGAGGGTPPFAGTFWAWFGGILVFEDGSIGQTIVIPPDATDLTFQLQIPIPCDSANDFLEVLIDGNQVFLVDGSSALCNDPTWHLQTVDITAFADGAPHLLEFHSTTFSTNGQLTNIFVDDIRIESGPVCDLNGACCVPLGTPIIRELVLIVDQSTSLSPAQFAEQIDGLKMCLANDIPHDGTWRVAVLAFSSVVTEYLGVLTPVTDANLINIIHPALDAIMQSLGATNLGGAIKRAREILTGVQSLSFDDFMLISSDGEWNIGPDPFVQANAAALQNIIINSVAIPQDSTGTMAQIANMTGGSFGIATTAADYGPVCQAAFSFMGSRPCTMQREDDCALLGGNFLGPNALCLPNTCPIPCDVAPPGRPDPLGSTDRVLRGFIVAWAIHPLTSEEIRFNHLSGGATLFNTTKLTAWEYSAFAAAAVSNVAHNAPLGTPGVLHLGPSGVQPAEYAPGFDYVLLDFFAVGAMPFNFGALSPTISAGVTLLPLDIDLRQLTTGPTVTKAEFLVWNENEFKVSGTRRCVLCWDQFLFTQFDHPNSFLITNLHTTKGRARIDGVAHNDELNPPVCWLDFNPNDGLPVGVDPRDRLSVDTSLIALQHRTLNFMGKFAESGTQLVGAGEQSAIIRWDYDAVGGGGAPEAPQPPVGWLASRLGAHDDVTRDSVPRALGPGAPPVRISNSSKGSLLLYAKVEVRWDADGNLIGDTMLTLSNDHDDSVRVQFYFVNGDDPLAFDINVPQCQEPGWNSFNTSITLTGNQPVYWRASDGTPLGLPAFTLLDPGNQP